MDKKESLERRVNDLLIAWDASASLQEDDFRDKSIYAKSRKACEAILELVRALEEEMTRCHLEVVK